MSGNYKELKTAQLLKPRLFPMQSRCVYGHHTESTCCLLSQSSPSESWLWGNTKRPGTLSWCHWSCRAVSWGPIRWPCFYVHLSTLWEMRCKRRPSFWEVTPVSTHAGVISQGTKYHQVQSEDQATLENSEPKHKWGWARDKGRLPRLTTGPRPGRASATGTGLPPCCL